MIIVRWALGIASAAFLAIVIIHGLGLEAFDIDKAEHITGLGVISCLMTVGALIEFCANTMRQRIRVGGVLILSAIATAGCMIFIAPRLIGIGHVADAYVFPFPLVGGFTVLFGAFLIPSVD